MEAYAQFLESKKTSVTPGGFEPDSLNPKLFEFQRDIDRWGIIRGKVAIFADCGLGKTPMQLEWANQVARESKRPVLILAPLAVSRQTEREGEKFDIPVKAVASDIEVRKGPNVYVTNYEKLHHFDPSRFGGVVLDESSILKSFSGATRNLLIEKFANTPMKLCCTATPAPNDFMELGNHSEFLGVLTRTEMLSTFFVHDGGDTSKWRLKGHAEEEYWKWICQWAVMIRKPSDLGYSDRGFELPPLNLHHHVVEGKAFEGFLFQVEAQTLMERRQARRASLEARAAMLAEIVKTKADEPWLIWCDLNDEGDLAEKLIPNSVQVAGRHSDEQKEDRMMGFSDGRYQILVSKPSVCGYGMNWQHCPNVAFLGLSDCYDQNTEVLTRTGWTGFDKISVTSELATVNQKTLHLEWQNPSRIVFQHYVGPMLHFQGQRNFDLLVTPNHKLFTQKCPIRFKDGDNSWQLRYAADIANRFRRQEYRMLSVPLPGTGNDPESIPIPRCGVRISSRSRIIDSIPADDFMKIAGWYLSEGYCRPLSSPERGRIVICQTDVHPEYRQEIIGLMKRIGLKVNTKTKDITGYSVQLATYLVAEFGAGSYFKRIPVWVKQLHPRLLTILRDTMMKGDGAASLRYYKSYSPALLDDFQELCLLTGWRASVHGNYATTAQTNLKPAIWNKPETVHYEGFIGCATVPNHTLIVRRNGIAVVSGNSWEMYYQAIRRVWRFGQTREVNCHIITSESEGAVVKNIERKEKDALRMAKEMARHMSVYSTDVIHGTTRTENRYEATRPMALPEWIRQ